MTEQNHPITPPPELVEKWNNLPLSMQEIIAIAWRNGADTELEACIAWFDKHIPGYELVADRLRAARRPKPPSLKKQAIALIDSCADPDGDYLDDNALSIIRRALEQLSDAS